MSDLSFKGQWQRRKSRRTHMNLLEQDTVWKDCQWFREEIKGKVVSFNIRQHNSSVLSLKRGWHSLQGGDWSSEKNLAQLPQEWSDSLSRLPLQGRKSQSRCPVQREESPEVKSREARDYSKVGKIQEWIYP